jgi:hypothetical protein
MIKKEIIELTEKIKNGEITLWEELLFQKCLLGYEFSDEELFNYILNVGYSHDTLFEFIMKVLGKDSSGICDEFITNNTIDRLVDKEYYYNSLFRHSSIVDLLYFVDIRNPKILLRYFLKNEKISFSQYYTNVYLKLLDFTIKRTKIRATKNNSYNIVLERLENYKKDFLERNRYIQ